MKKVNSIKIITILILMPLTLTIFPIVSSAYNVPGGDIDHPATVLVDDENDLKKAIKYASITGAISVTKVGSRFSIPNLYEVIDYDKVI